MSRSSSIPSYRLHKQSGQAVVTLADGLGGRRDVLLGKHGSAESRAEYLRVISEWEINGHRLPQIGSAPSDRWVSELILAYWKFAETYYVKNGRATSQQERVKRSLRFVRELYGHTRATAFGPLALKAVRGKMVEAGWTRIHVNHCVGCIKRMFKWAVENELVPPSVYHGLQAVAGLKKDRSEAREGQRVLPVADAHVDATLPFLTPPVRALVQVQRLSGMRPGEAVVMRPMDIERRGKVWLYRPESHKTEHHGHERVVILGPQAQTVLRPFLFAPFLQDVTAIQLALMAETEVEASAMLGDRLLEIGAARRDPTLHIFSPAEAIADFRRRQRTARKSKVQPSQQDRRKQKKRKAPGASYRVGSYAHAVARSVEAANTARACDGCKELPPESRCDSCRAAAIPHWHPHQLRHSCTF